jgi:hypothetical protein
MDFDKKLALDENKETFGGSKKEVKHPSKV